jgi:cell division protein FtsA
MIRQAHQEDTVIGLDVGTTKVCAVVGEIVENELEIIGIGTSASTGLRKGVVMNIESTVESIKKAVKATESFTGVEISAVYLGITGSHVKGFDSHGAVGIRGREVTYLDIDNVIDSAKAVYIPLNREVLHVIPAGYTLDGRNSIMDPVGMTGEKLEAKVHILTGSVIAIQDLLTCCEQAGLEVIDIVFEPIASAKAVLTDKEKEQGVVMIDIGGGTTDVILYKNGCLRHEVVLAVGGNHFTNDIAVGLRISVAEAERIKKAYGSATECIENGEDRIHIIQQEHTIKVHHECLAEIIQPRAEELFHFIKDKLVSSAGCNSGLTGVVLTGGGSLLNGLDSVAEEVLGLPVRIGFPNKIKKCKGNINNPMYATGVGLTLYGFAAEANRVMYPDAVGGTFTGVFGKMREWVAGILHGNVKSFMVRQVKRISSCQWKSGQGKGQPPALH